VQYGANQPGYDLVVSDGDNTLHLSVKGSTNGWWVLTTKDKNGTYQEALDKWIGQNGRFVFCLMQFSRVNVAEMPRMYIATGEEIGKELKTHWFGEIALSLTEHYAPTRGKHKGRTVTIPAGWHLTEDRIRELIRKKVVPIAPA
jgi:hypothetical protein